MLGIFKKTTVTKKSCISVNELKQVLFDARAGIDGYAKDGGQEAA